MTHIQDITIDAQIRLLESQIAQLKSGIMALRDSEPSRKVECLERVRQRISGIQEDLKNMDYDFSSVYSEERKLPMKQLDD